MTRLTLPTLVAAVVLIGGVFTASAQPYALIPINGLPGFERVVPTDINNRLQVVGYAGTGEEARAFIWDPVNGFRLLPVLRDGEHHVWIDDAGVVYGEREVDGVTRFTRVIGEQAYDLPALPVATAASILQVTNNGIVLLECSRCARWMAVLGI